MGAVADRVAIRPQHRGWAGAGPGQSALRLAGSSCGGDGVCDSVDRENRGGIPEREGETRWEWCTVVDDRDIWAAFFFTTAAFSPG